MKDGNPPTKARLRPATVEFIEHRLPKHHPAFVNPPVRYDAMSGKYVSKGQELVPRFDDCALASPDDTATPLDDCGFPARPAYISTDAMRFWNDIFPDAIAKFTSTDEPSGRSKSGYSIRNKPNWEAIYDVLQSAQNKYEKDRGPMGWLRKRRRIVADKTTPVADAAKIATKFVSNSSYVTPVLAAVDVLFDVRRAQEVIPLICGANFDIQAVKTAAGVRTKALEGVQLDGLIPIFSDVEMFLGTFPSDSKIWTTSVDLIVTTLVAVEKAIGFFISNEFSRGGKALLLVSNYEKSLLQSLDEISTKSRGLMQEALKSHIHEVHLYSQETRKIHRLWVKTVLAVQSIGDGVNALEALLADHLVEKDRQLEDLRRENSTLRVENVILRASSPFQQSSSYHLPRKAPVMEWYISQEALRRMLDSPNLDMTDIAFINARKTELPEKQRAQAQQVVNMKLFRDWIRSQFSAKLLVQWGPPSPQTIAGVSPLSVFCTTMAQALRNKQRFVSLLWFCGRHVDAEDSHAPPGGGRAMLASLVDQLLRQHTFDTSPLQGARNVDLAALQARRPEAQLALLDWLVRQLPAATTLVCLVDGVALFEREEFQAEALPVFARLLRLCGDKSVRATFKVLFTSVPGPDIVRRAFEEEDLILDVNGLPLLAAAASEERMTRELGESSGA